MNQAWRVFITISQTLSNGEKTHQNDMGAYLTPYIVDDDYNAHGDDPHSLKMDEEYEYLRHKKMHHKRLKALENALSDTFSRRGNTGSYETYLRISHSDMHKALNEVGHIVVTVWSSSVGIAYREIALPRLEMQDMVIDGGVLVAHT